MTLLAPNRLLLLVVVLGLAVAYVAVQVRRRPAAVRHPGLALATSVAPRRAGWRRHLAALVGAGAIVTLVVGLARPAYSASVPRKEAVVVLAIDVSGSMGATDVRPTRLAAAVAAAKSFIAAAPPTYRIGLVDFDTAGHTLVTPTTDRDAVAKALDTLKPTTGTAAGEGLGTAVDLITASTGGKATAAAKASAKPYSAVVLLTDGGNTVGRSLATASKEAKAARIPVYTIAYGTDGGTVTIAGKTEAVPSDPAAMAAVATATGGTTFTATSSSELTRVYDQIGTHIGHVVKTMELTTTLAAVAAALVAAAFVATTLWSPRLT